MADREAQFRAIAAMLDAFARLDADEFASHLTEDVAFLHTMSGEQAAELRTWPTTRRGSGNWRVPRRCLSRTRSARCGRIAAWRETLSARS